MLLATRCPFCETVFRLQPAQLALRRGLVRCGHCHEVFDASSSLFELNDRRRLLHRQTHRRSRGDRGAVRRTSEGPRFQRGSLGSVGTGARRRDRQPSAAQRQQSAAYAGVHRCGRRGHAASRHRARTAGQRVHLAAFLLTTNPFSLTRRSNRSPTGPIAAADVPREPCRVRWRQAAIGRSAAGLAQDRASIRTFTVLKNRYWRAGDIAWHP